MANRDQGAVSVLRRSLPAGLFRQVRRLAIAFAAPVRWSVASGHFRSSLAERAVDKSGNALPWYSYPAIELLQRKNFAGKRVLEFGAGQSTLWWAARAEHVLAFDAKRDWYERLIPLMPANVTLHYAADSTLAGMEHLLTEQKFDVIVIDGMNRARMAQLSPDLLAEGGAILIDNSEGYGFDGFASIAGYFRPLDFERVDFYGAAPGLLGNHVTSVLFRGRCFLFAGEEEPELRHS